MKNEKKKKKKKKNYIVSRCILSVLLVGVIGMIAYTAVAMPDAPLFEEASKQEDTSSKDESSKQEDTSSKDESSKQESTTSTPESSIEEGSQQTSEPSSEVSEASTPAETIKINLNQNPTSNSAGMKKYIENYGFSFDSLYCSQMIVVDTQGSDAQIYCFQKSDKGYWFNIVKEGEALTTQAFVSENGISFNINSENKCTPLGMYPLDEVFYIDDKPKTDYDNLVHLTNNMYWVTDTGSQYYNKMAIVEQKDWNSAIHFYDDKDTYQYGVVVGYNTGTVDKTKSCGIFMQCGTQPTDGSIALPTEAMKAVVEWLDSSVSGFILIM